MLGHIQKILAVVSFILLGSALMLAYNNPVTGYELDIYASTPLAFWLLVIISILIGAAIILTQIVTGGYENSKIWLIGLIVILSSRIVLLYFPYIRGYVSWRGDNIAYLGFIRDILANGDFSSSNVYPVTHIYLSGIINITDLPDILVANLSTGIISILAVLFIYMLTGALSSNKRIQILSTLIAGTVMLAAGYNVILSPNGWSVFFLPLLLFLYLKQDILRYRVLLIIILIIYPFFHPLSTLIVIVMIFIIEITKPVFRRYLRDEIHFNTEFHRSTFLACIVIEIAIFGMWMLSHSDYHLNLKIFWEEIIYGMNTGKLGELTSSLDKLNIHGADFIVLLLKMYGTEMILILMMGLGVPLLLFKRFSDNKIDKVSLLTVLCFVIVCGVLYIAYLLGMPGTKVLAGGQWDRRILSYITMLLPVFAAILLNRIILSEKPPVYVSYLMSYKEILLKQALRFTGGTILIVLLIFSCLLSIQSLYPSPFMSQPNTQITTTDLKGTEWLLDNVDTESGVDFIASPPENFAMAIIGFDDSYGKTGFGRYTDPVIDNFGYTAQLVIGSRFTASRYLVVTDYDKIAYTSIWKEVGRFNENDFNVIENDPIVCRVYSNSGMNVYYISPDINMELVKSVDGKAVR
ncbi:MAG: hypothetical protein JW915_04135 [Chitinispirillaceae bacterium]|nr:hypothetical protein [Chitinispirillaceae bacterium]